MFYFQPDAIIKTSDFISQNKVYEAEKGYEKISKRKFKVLHKSWVEVLKYFPNKSNCGLKLKARHAEQEFLAPKKTSQLEENLKMIGSVTGWRKKIYPNK